MTHVVIGACPACGRPLKAKEHAPRARMHVTCHCGWHGEIHPPESQVQHAEELRAQGAGRRHRKSTWERLVNLWRNWWRRRS